MELFFWKNSRDSADIELGYGHYDRSELFLLCIQYLKMLNII